MPRAADGAAERRVLQWAAYGAGNNGLTARGHHDISHRKHELQVKPPEPPQRVCNAGGCHSKVYRACFTLKISKSKQIKINSNRFGPPHITSNRVGTATNVKRNLREHAGFRFSE